MTKSGSTLLCLLPFSMSIGQAAAMDNPNICYALDGILFIYGFILTILYCRLKLKLECMTKQASAKKEASERVYEGLSQGTHDIYESIHLKKTHA